MSDTIDCPKCGAEHSPNGIHEDDEGEHICEKCSFSFTVSIDYSPEYHSQCAELVSDCFAQLDAEDEERLLDIEYRCPECDHEWQEQWSCACDSQCPNCGVKNISALSWDEADR